MPGTSFVLSRALLLHQPLNGCLAIVSSPIFLVFAVPCCVMTTSGSAIITGLTVWFVLAVGLRIIASIMQSIRRAAFGDSATRIVLFRHFSQSNAAIVHQHLLPALACYGRVILIADDTFKSGSKYHEDRWFVPSSHGGVEPDQFAEIQNLPSTNPRWRQMVSSEINKASLVLIVVDTEQLSPNLNWELSEALTKLEKQQIVVASTVPISSLATDAGPLRSLRLHQNLLGPGSVLIRSIEVGLRAANDRTPTRCS